MKKIILSVLVIMTFSSLAIAQKKDEGFKFHLGIKGGANMNKINGQSFKDGYELGYQVGAFAEIDLNKNIGIQPEVLFSQSSTKVAQGFKDIYQNIDNAVLDDNVRLNYLSVPVLLRINTGKLLTFHVGPEFSILVNDHENLLENGQNAFKKGDFGMIAGAQVNLGTLRIYGRYNVGLTNINDIDNQDKWKNQQLQLGLGLRLL